MSEMEINQDDAMLDALIVQALETQPQPAIPADFAARIASRLPARKQASFRPRYFGLAFSWIGAIALIVALFFLAPSPAGVSSAGAWIELFVCTQFLCLVVWMALRAHRTYKA
ncbi:hypothetical protein [Terriglobus saanensis]|uniref:Uncharacterized protein n=1 Tax=Terriglobus saanensis (strain ATCC BAA-1853 / DSM 23119 / SP1PR4) TaxID=401053 RepID=E8V1N7_TERSS|nr:hypothetical protein [Terriglobus saanensis]ADV82318.1 hypothetical protein AciPR4_1495 [Terriglobus saanensis SP1PR4]